MKKITTIFISLFIALFATTSCENYLDVNDNVDSPEKVEPYLRLGPILGSYTDFGWETRWSAPLVQFMGTTNATYNTYAKHSYVGGADNAAEAWRIVYWLHGMNLEDLINEAQERGQYKMAGIGYAIKAYAWHLLTNTYGDAPLHDAFVKGLLTHRYDTQQEIYEAVRSWAYAAIANFNKVDSYSYSGAEWTYDLLYKGNVNQWEKFAYGVLARNYLCYSNKMDFLSGKRFVDSVIYCADKSFTSAIDDSKIPMLGQTSSNSNFWGIQRGGLGRTYVQSDYAVQVLTGTIPTYNVAGDKQGLLNPQITADAASYDPRTVLLLGTTDTRTIKPDPKTFTYIGTRPGAASNGGAASFYGPTSNFIASNCGTGRWMYRDNAYWPLMTYAEIQFCKAEAAYLKGDKAMALEAFKNGVGGHMDFCESYIHTALIGGDKVDRSEFRAMVPAYLASPYVDMPENDLTLSHIMMQKWISYYPWGNEVWADLRRHNYDLVLGADGVPAKDISYTANAAFHKDDNDPNRIYKGFYLPSARVQDRKIDFPISTEGAPCYRMRPRYNSEYMWNVKSLEALTPISGTDDMYNSSIMWFAKPGN